MRFGLVALTTLALAGCGSFRDVFTSHADTAARVGNKELESAKVAEIITRLGGPTANPDASNLIAGIWVDLNLFADRVAEGQLKTDSALMARLLWPQITEAKIQAWHDSIIDRRVTLTDAAVDSAYMAGNVRLFQHILWMATGSSAADTAKAKATAERIAPQARTGDFGKLAAEHSADGSKADNGYLPVGPKGQFVPEFDNAAWALEPGQVSGVVKTQYGFHVIRRPTLAEARDRFKLWHRQAQIAQVDSVYMADLNAKAEITPKAGVAASVRTAAADPSAVRNSGKVLVTYKGGSFKMKDLVPWIEALPFQSVGQIKMANDSVLEAFARSLAQNVILLRQADSAKVTMRTPQFEAMSNQYRLAIESLKEAIGLNTPEFSDSSKTPEADRKKLAETKVADYFEKLTKGEAQFRQIPPTLSSELRRDGDYRIYAQGVAKAKELINAQRVKDSAAAAGKSAAPGLEAAPGGPPVPGGAPKPDSTKTP